jgi:hypothetical protein
MSENRNMFKLIVDYTTHVSTKAFSKKVSSISGIKVSCYDAEGIRRLLNSKI